jgi:hypothetical protein
MIPPNFDPNQFDQLILERLPILVRQNKQIQELVLELARENFAQRQETEDRFYQLLNELKRDREEQARKWDEQNRKWDKNQQELERLHEEIMAIAQKQDRSFGALGARWGIQAENTFRNALAAILEKSFNVKVTNVNEYDNEGTVFGRPDQVELDVIIKNGLLIICEIKSSVSKSDMYTFERKVRFYEKRHQQPVSRMLVISPMIDVRAQSVAKQLGIEIYTDSLEVKSL